MKDVEADCLTDARNSPLVFRALTLGFDIRPYVESTPSKTARALKGEFSTRVRLAVERFRSFLDSRRVSTRSLRLAVSPIGLLNSSWGPGYVELAQALDTLAVQTGVDFVGGFSTFAASCLDRAQTSFLEELPECLSTTRRLCGFVEVARSSVGLNLDAVSMAARALRGMNDHGLALENEPSARFCIACNTVSGTPYMPLGYHDLQRGDTALYVGVGGVKAINEALSRAPGHTSLHGFVNTISSVIRARTEIAHSFVEEAKADGAFSSCSLDSTLAPLPIAPEHSLLEVLRKIGVNNLQTPGSLTALALLNDAVKRGSVASGSPYLSGLSGSFFSISEDVRIQDWLQDGGTLNLDRALALTAVCSVGLDMIVLPKGVCDDVLMGIISDEMALGMVHQKTTSTRLILSDEAVGREVVFKTNRILGKTFVLPKPPDESVQMMRSGGTVPRPWRMFSN